MEVPDKIWINTDTLNGYHMSNHPLYGEEYIRKNDLLEWANNWKKLGVSEDFLYAMETLVQHLNSM